MGRWLSGTVLRVAARRTLGAAILGIGCQITPSFAQPSEPPPEKQSATALPEVRVTGQRARPRTATRVAPVQPSTVNNTSPERATGPVTGYLANQSATGTKTDTPLLETPQSISVVTKDQMQAQGAQNISEALRYTPGVSVDTYSANTFFDAIKIRGFDAPRYLDGLRLPLDPGTQFAYPGLRPTVLNGLKS